MIGAIFGDNPRPYNSWGNGSAMRVSACGWIGTSLDEVKSLYHMDESCQGSVPQALEEWTALSPADRTLLRKAAKKANAYARGFTKAAWKRLPMAEKFAILRGER